MRVVVDLQGCQSGSRLGGIGSYALDLVIAMIEAAPDRDFVILLNARFPEGANAVRFRLRSLLPPDRFVVFRAPAGCAALGGDAALTRAAEVLRETVIRNLRPDAVLITSVIEGIHDDAVMSIPSAPDDPPTAAILYDLAPILTRATAAGDRPSRAHVAAKVRELRNAACLLAISQYAADEFREASPGYNGTIVPIRAGFDRKFRVLDGLGDAGELLPRHGLKRRFILCTADLNDRKNQAGLIEAFARLPSGLRRQLQLALAGEGPLDTVTGLKEFARSRGLSDEDVVFLGAVPDDDLVRLYNICDLFAFPPKHEGLGLQPLEAMACGAVVIGSATTSTAEIVGWPEALFDPYDVGSIAATLERALTDEPFREESRRRARKQVDALRWDGSAAAALRALDDLVTRKVERSGRLSGVDTTSERLAALGEQRLRDADRVPVAFCAATNDLITGPSTRGSVGKVGWITTWRTKCGIATTSEHMLAAGQVPVTILAAKTDDLVEGGETDGVLRSWRQDKEDDLLELDSAIEQSGIDVLVLQFSFAFFDPARLAAFLDRQFSAGRKVFFAMHATDVAALLAPLAPSLARVTGVFVHSMHDVARLAAYGVADNVTLLPLGIRLYRPTPGKIERSARPRVATYGFFLPGKGLAQTVEAVALLAGTPDEVEIVMVNAEYPLPVSRDFIDEVRQAIERLGITDRVTLVTDFLSDQDSFDLLASADLILYPYDRSGESASGAVRMGLSTGRPVAVSPLPIFDDVRDATLTLPGTGAADIAQGVAAMLRGLRDGDPAFLRATERARRWTDSNSYERINAFLFDTIAHRSAVDSWLPEFQADLAALPLGNGRLVGGRIVSRGAGTVCSGPNLTLAPGRYALSVAGSCPARTGGAALHVSVRGGREIVASHPLVEAPGGRLLDVEIVVRQETADVEFVFETKGDAALTLDGYRLDRHYG